MDPGLPNILHKPEKLKVTLRKYCSRMKRLVAVHSSKTQAFERSREIRQKEVELQGLKTSACP